MFALKVLFNKTPMINTPFCGVGFDPTKRLSSLKSTQPLPEQRLTLNHLSLHLSSQGICGAEQSPNALHKSIGALACSILILTSAMGAFPGYASKQGLRTCVLQ